ncbi:MAG TPA: allophanate hydrolase, partial [Solirubrobacteraceae bacterium]|nr:allophanate hydrolase [Solirubrobacteraceae bacterium]
RLRAAGAVVVGKTNLDQFATGLVGTRSPYGAARDIRRPDRVGGGSSSGSALAVGLGEVDIALGTDTAGSGRVPAAFAGIFGLKPTRGIVPTSGVVPACRTLDCVSVFAPGHAQASVALQAIGGSDRMDARSRGWPSSAPLGAPANPRVGIPGREVLDDLSPESRAAFAAFAERLAGIGATLVDVDLQPMLAAGELLYGGGFLAERYAGVGAFVDDHPGAVDPIVAGIITAGASIPGHRLVADVERLDLLGAELTRRTRDLDLLLVPTVGFQPTLADVAADPVGVNNRLGRFTTPTNLLDMCALAHPAGQADGGCFGVSLLAPAFSDLVLLDIAGRLAPTGEAPAGFPTVFEAEGDAVELFVLGAHRTGQPLNHQLTDRGGRPLGVTSTAPTYRMHRLDTEPPKPGLVRVERGGGPIEGELWAMPAAGLASLLGVLPAPMSLGAVALAGGRSVVGFLCEPIGLENAPDISAHGSWPAFLASQRTSVPAG